MWLIPTFRNMHEYEWFDTLVYFWPMTARVWTELPWDDGSQYSGYYTNLRLYTEFIIPLQGKKGTWHTKLLQSWSSDLNPE